ncbi:hypothetical protein RMATCC62417_04656 [Rhizopus microsporus]|nr:hypothetical protein RMATCC62417_04656 [Rhizopus microsporus]
MNRNGNRNEPSSNRVRGPTSALSSFLREQGIQVPNRSRRARREEQATPRDMSIDPPTPSDEASSMEGVEQTVTVAAQSSSSSLTTTTATEEMTFTASSSKKKRKDDSDDDDDVDFAPSSSRKVVKGRARILFCVVCKSRFARDINDDNEETLCSDCKAGKSPNKPVKPKKKRLNVSKKEQLLAHDRVPSLQDICISIVVEYIDEVETFGFISDESFEKLAKIISRNRKLNNQISRLFMEPYRKTLSLYDCTNMDENALMNVAHFCPRMERLELIYCGQINDKVLRLYQERLHNLKSLFLSGAFLVTKEAWISFFETTNKRLEAFGLRHSNRFDLTCIESLSKLCPNLQSLNLGQLGSLTSKYLPHIAKLTKLTKLELAWPSNEEEDTEQTTNLIHMLEEVGPQLTELSLRGFYGLTDDVLLKGIMKHCKNLKKLNVEQSEQLTAEAAVQFFENWEAEGLTYLDISRCILLNDEVLKVAIRRFGNTLTHLNIHSLELLSPNGLEVLAGVNENEKDYCHQLTYLNCSFVRAMDDFVLQKLITKCKSLQDIHVWGCHLITNAVNAQINPLLRIIGRETSTISLLNT